MSGVAARVRKKKRSRGKKNGPQFELHILEIKQKKRGKIE